MSQTLSGGAWLAEGVGAVDALRAAGVVAVAVREAVARTVAVDGEDVVLHAAVVEAPGSGAGDSVYAGEVERDVDRSVGASES